MDILCFGGQTFATAVRYARSEAGREPKLEESRTVRRSEAALIPALLLGELVDPNGNGAKLNSQFQNPTQAVVDSIPANNPLYGKTFEEVKAVFSDQIIGERLKVETTMTTIIKITAMTTKTTILQGLQGLQSLQ